MGSGVGGSGSDVTCPARTEGLDVSKAGLF